MPPLDYVGDDTATQAPSALPAKSATPTARLPVDGETLNVASVYQPFKMLTDGLDTFFDRGAWIDAANTWTALQSFARTGDVNPNIDFTAAITTRKLELSFPVGSYTTRVYRNASGWIEIVTNASWYDSGAGVFKWQRDAAGDATKVVYAFNGRALYIFDSASASPWVDGSWVVVESVTDTGLVVSGTVQSTGNISSDGDINAATGKITAGGTVAGDSGDGLVKAKRFYGTGTALVAGDFGTFTNWGAGATATPIGNDTSGQVTMTAAGVPAADPLFTLTFKDGTFTVGAIVLVVFSWTNDPAITTASAAAMWTNTATTLTVTLKTAGVAPTAGSLFIFSWHVIGK